MTGAPRARQESPTLSSILKKKKKKFNFDLREFGQMTHNLAQHVYL